MRHISQPYDYLFKMLLIGDSGTGKTALMNRFADDSWVTNPTSTIGVDFKIRTVRIDGHVVKLQLWDTAGQERFRSITCTYYRGAQGILVVYDITDKQSFDSCTGWLREIHDFDLGDVDIALIGNKSDREDQRAVSREEGAQLAEEHGMLFLETSALNSSNVIEAFSELTTRIRDRILVDQLVDRRQFEDGDTGLPPGATTAIGPFLGHSTPASTGACCSK